MAGIYLPAKLPPMSALHSMKTARIDGLRLAYLEMGPAKAETVVLLHGYLGSHQVWRHQTHLLARRYRVLAPDWFGWGRSERNPQADYRFEREVSRLAEVLDALGTEQPTIVGHDYGGFLALGLALRSPRRISRLGIVNSRTIGTFTRTWKTVFGTLSLACRSQRLRTVIESAPLGAIHRRMLAPLVREGIFSSEILEDYVGWMDSRPDGPAFYTRFMAQYRVAVRRELSEGPAKLTCPTAVIWGARDAYIPRSVAENLLRAIPGAQLTLVEDAGHFLPEQRPEAVSNAIERLLSTPVSR